MGGHAAPLGTRARKLWELAVVKHLDSVAALLRLPPPPTLILISVLAGGSFTAVGTAEGRK